MTYSDGESLQSFSIHAVGVGAQQLPSLLTLIVQTLKTEAIQSQTPSIHSAPCWQRLTLT